MPSLVLGIANVVKPKCRVVNTAFKFQQGSSLPALPCALFSRPLALSGYLSETSNVGLPWLLRASPFSAWVFLRLFQYALSLSCSTELKAPASCWHRIQVPLWVELSPHCFTCSYVRMQLTSCFQAQMQALPGCKWCWIHTGISQASVV